MPNELELDCDTGTNTRPGGAPGPSRALWWWLYFVLVAFVLLAIGSSLYLNYRLVQIHETSVQVNQEWADHLNQISRAAELGSAVDAPGNDIFASGDVVAESTRLRNALADFESEFAGVEASLLQSLAGTHTNRIHTELEYVRDALKEMASESGLIFDCFRAHEPGKAAEHMAKLDRHNARLGRGFSQLSQHVREIQAENFRTQRTQTAQLRRYEYSVAGAILLLVLAATLYGLRMGLAFIGLTKEKDQFLAALHKSHAELEARVQARTADLERTNALLTGEITRRSESQKQLEQIQNEMIQASRQAGMAEVATGVLHNVGNVLNSVNVSASLLQEKLGKSQVQNLVKATNLLRDNAADTAAFLTQDPRGQRLPGYLIKLGEHLAKERSTWEEELEGLRKNIEHIKQIVAMQQSFASLSGMTETLPAEELVADALRLNEAALVRHGIQVVREFAATPPVAADRHKVLQILINLIRNAKSALGATARGEKWLRISIQVVADDRVQIAIRDNGSGIAPENLPRIFQHGFTTKQDGHGFGLHSSINAAREMGGNLTVESDGPQTGACFTLELPVAKTEACPVTISRPPTLPATQKPNEN